MLSAEEPASNDQPGARADHCWGPEPAAWGRISAISFWNRALSPVFGGAPQSKLHTSILQANDYKRFGSANGGRNRFEPSGPVRSSSKWHILNELRSP
jgi:hypothetical protein